MMQFFYFFKRWDVSKRNHQVTLVETKKDLPGQVKVSREMPTTVL